jgi:hypothetical protein
MTIKKIDINTSRKHTKNKAFYRTNTSILKPLMMQKIMSIHTHKFGSHHMYSLLNLWM